MRPVRVKYIPRDDSYQLKLEKNKKSVVKKQIVWPDDPEASRQGQKADCGEDLTSIEEEDRMDCELDIKRIAVGISNGRVE